MKKIIYPLLSTFALLSILLSACRSPSERHPVKTGLDIVRENQFKQFSGKRIGVICNHTACDSDGRHIIDLISENRTCQLVAVFAPEHGFRGMHADGSIIENKTEPKTGAIIYSLYGSVRQPTSDMLKDVDVLIYDIQDVGARFYTYITTLSLAMESAANYGIPFVVLDRPNPIRGDVTEGPVLDMNFQSFVGPHPIPIRYGLTIGELAGWINGEIFSKRNFHVDLTVIQAKGWRRSLWYDQTGLPWIAPSPNMPTLETAIVYPGFCLLEGTSLSEGRGTDAPFLKFGAPWIDPEYYAKELNNLRLPGLRFEPISFTPASIPNVALSPKYENQPCSGVRTIITDRNRLRSVGAMLMILEKTRDLYPDDFSPRSTLNRLYGSDRLQQALNEHIPIQQLISDWQENLEQFTNRSKNYYLYE